MLFSEDLLHGAYCSYKNFMHLIVRHPSLNNESTVLLTENVAHTPPPSACGSRLGVVARENSHCGSVVHVTPKLKDAHYLFLVRERGLFLSMEFLQSDYCRLTSYYVKCTVPVAIMYTYNYVLTILC